MRHHILLNLAKLLGVHPTTCLLVIDKSSKILNLLLLHVVIHHKQLLLLGLPLVHRLFVLVLLFCHLILFGCELNSAYLLLSDLLLFFLALRLHLIGQLNLRLHLLLRLLGHTSLLNNLIRFPHLIDQVLLPRAHLLGVVRQLSRRFGWQPQLSIQFLPQLL